MKSIIKKIAMLSMLVSMANLNADAINECMKACKGQTGFNYQNCVNNCTRPNFLMKEAINEQNVTTVKIKVLNLPINTFIATGNLQNGINANYLQQKPNADGTYSFYSNHYYAAAANDRNSFSNQRKGSEFIGNTKWDVTNNIIS